MSFYLFSGGWREERATVAIEGLTINRTTSGKRLDPDIWKGQIGLT